MDIKTSIKEFLHLGQNDMALLLIREFEGSYPFDTEMLIWKARLLMDRELWDEAEKTLITAVGLDHKKGEYYRRMAEIKRRKKAPLLAASLFRRALELTEDEGEKALVRADLEEAEREAAQQTTPEIAVSADSTGSEKSATFPYTEPERPLVSIIVLAYNHLEHTKPCIESIYRYTSHLPFELITVNNGSSDGTEDYFNSLPNRKKVNLALNSGVCGGFNAGIIVADGTYTACIANDFILTPNWLDNLIACLESDERIGFVSPGANVISNHQAIHCPAPDVEGMLAFAAEYNVSNPRLWEDRVRLLPCVLMMRTELLKTIGYYDPRYMSGEFCDDDISFRIRRAGYRLVFARDTYTHHYGSLTVSSNPRRWQQLMECREVFRTKFGIDAWEDTFFDSYIVNLSSSLAPGQTEGSFPPVRVLGINSRCGSTPLMLANRLREAGYDSVALDFYTDDPKYVTDLQTLSDHVVCSPMADLKSMATGEKYDLILLEGGLESYLPVEGVLKDIRMLLGDGGAFVFKIRNGAHYLEIARLLSGQPMLGEPEVASTYFHVQPFLQLLTGMGLSVRCVLNVIAPVQPQTEGLYRRMGDLAKTDDLIRNAALSSSEILIAAGDVS